jgi:hypothetical protein
MSELNSFNFILGARPDSYFLSRIPKKRAVHLIKCFKKMALVIKIIYFASAIPIE